MKVVIDSNRVIAALIKDSTTRKILFNNNFEFIAPDSITMEVDKYKDVIIEKSGITEKNSAFCYLLSLSRLLLFHKMNTLKLLKNSRMILRIQMMSLTLLLAFPLKQKVYGPMIRISRSRRK